MHTERACSNARSRTCAHTCARTHTHVRSQSPLPHLALVAEQPEWHGVGNGEGQEFELERRPVKCKVDAAVGPRRRRVEAAAKERQPSALPARWWRARRGAGGWWRLQSRQKQMCWAHGTATNGNALHKTMQRAGQHAMQRARMQRAPGREALQRPCLCAGLSLHLEQQQEQQSHGQCPHAAALMRQQQQTTPQCTQSEQSSERGTTMRARTMGSAP